MFHYYQNTKMNYNSHINRLWILLTIIVISSCHKPQARKPKQHSTTNFYKELIENSKKLNKREDNIIKYYIATDTVHTYQISPKGFWFYYDKKNTVASDQPKTGDIVKILYDIRDIENKILYSKEELGAKELKIDRQDFIPALHDGIKLMKKGEIITFVIPSYRAFGVAGDQNRIGINQTIKSTVTLLDIKK